MNAHSTDLRGLLNQLEARLEAFGAPIAGVFRPGADAHHVREMLVTEGLPPHADLVTWWGWHDGVQSPTSPVTDGPGIYYRPATTLLGPWHILGLDEALRIRRFLGEAHWGLPIEQAFPPSWIPILTTDGAGELCADAAAVPEAALHIRDEGYLGGERPLFLSIGELVACMVEAFDAGHVVLGQDGAGTPWLDTQALAGGQRRLAWW
jgi:hypothetical protein